MYVVSEVGGIWGSARLLPGLAALNTGGNSAVGSLSCVASGYWAIAGTYVDKPGNVRHEQVFTDIFGCAGRGVFGPQAATGRGRMRRPAH